MSHNKGQIFKLLECDGSCSLLVENNYPDLRLPSMFTASIAVIMFTQICEFPLGVDDDVLLFNMNMGDGIFEKCVVPWDSVIGLEGKDISVRFSPTIVPVGAYIPFCDNKRMLLN